MYGGPAKVHQRKIKLADVCDITGYRRDELNYVLREIPSYSVAKQGVRTSREFTPLDLLALSVVFELDKNYGLRLKAIAQIADHLRHALSQPRTLSEDAWLVISVLPPKVEYTDSPRAAESGIIVGLKDIFPRVDHFCNAFRIESERFQSNLALGPGLLRPTRMRSPSK